MRAQRLAGYCAIVIPTAVVLFVFVWAWSSSTGSGAGMDEANRPIGFIMLAVFGAAGWLIGTLAMASLFRVTTRLPGLVRAFALITVRGPGYAGSIGHGPWPDTPAVTDDEQSVSVVHLLGLAFIELPILMFTAPLLAGLFIQGGVYRPGEAAWIEGMALIATAWTVYLVVETRPRREPRPA